MLLSDIGISDKFTKLHDTKNIGKKKQKIYNLPSTGSFIWTWNLVHNSRIAFARIRNESSSSEGNKKLFKYSIISALSNRSAHSMSQFKSWENSVPNRFSIVIHRVCSVMWTSNIYFIISNSWHLFRKLFINFFR